MDHAALDYAVDALEARSRTLAGRHAGPRDVFAVPALAALAENAEIRRLAGALLGKEAFVVRALFFDKNAEANWNEGRGRFPEAIRHLASLRHL
jgi:hypothetical protein